MTTESTPNDGRGQAFRDLFKKMTFTEEQEKRAIRQRNGDLLRYLRHAKANHDFNCDQYDPLARMTPEEREGL